MKRNDRWIPWVLAGVLGLALVGVVADFAHPEDLDPDGLEVSSIRFDYDLSGEELNGAVSCTFYLQNTTRGYAEGRLPLTVSPDLSKISGGFLESGWQLFGERGLPDGDGDVSAHEREVIQVVAGYVTRRQRGYDAVLDDVALVALPDVDERRYAAFVDVALQPGEGAYFTIPLNLPAEVCKYALSVVTGAWW